MYSGLSNTLFDALDTPYSMTGRSLAVYFPSSSEAPRRGGGNARHALPPELLGRVYENAQESE